MKVVDGVTRSVRRRALLAVVIVGAGLGFASVALAEAGPVDLKVVDRETGHELPVWTHGGRMFVAGRPGDRYGLHVRNRTEGRLLLVLSVDGVNVYTGETAGFQQTGYVLNSHAAFDVTGWRKSQTEVAAFTFAALPRSYAALTGRPGEVGVIGLAAFKERAVPQFPEAAPARPAPRRSGLHPPRPDLPPPPPLPIPPTPAPVREAPADAASSSARAAPSPAAVPQAPDQVAAASRSDEKLGTAHGTREWSRVAFTTFERASAYPQAVWRIEYDTYPNLVARGVVDPSPYADRRPRPFPLEPGPAGFVPDPPGER